MVKEGRVAVVWGWKLMGKGHKGTSAVTEIPGTLIVAVVALGTLCSTGSNVSLRLGVDGPCCRLPTLTL